MLPDVGEVKKRRKALNLTQGVLAKISGVSQSFVAKLRKAKSDPAYSLAKRVFDALEAMETRTEKKAKELMNPRVFSVSRRDKISKAVRLIRNKGISQLPEVYLGDLPIMTETGTFVINGAERAVVSQLARSPGVYFKDTIDYSGRILYSAQVIPSEGAWLDFDTDANGVISVKIGQTHRFPATTLLRAMSSIHTVPGSEELRTSLDTDIIALFGQPHELESPTSDQLTGKRAWEDIIDPNTGEVLVEHGQRIDRETATPHRRTGAAARGHLRNEPLDRDDVGERSDAQ